MSYDIFFVAYIDEKPTKDEVVRLLNDRGADEPENETPAPQFDVQRRALVEDLLTLHPSLKYRPDKRGPEFGGCVKTDGEDSQIPDINIWPTYALVSVSYSADPDVAEEAFKKLIAVFERHSYIPYDPQSGKLIGTKGGKKASSRMKRTAADVVHMLETGGPRPWWKFWT